MSASQLLYQARLSSSLLAVCQKLRQNTQKFYARGGRNPGFRVLFNFQEAMTATRRQIYLPEKIAEEMAMVARVLEGTELGPHLCSLLESLYREPNYQSLIDRAKKMGDVAASQEIV